MRKIISIIFSLTILLVACSEKPVTIPEDVIKQKEMAGILTDIHLAQSAIGELSRTDSSTYTMKDYLAFILKQHNVKKEDLLRSLKFYSEQPEILGQVYDSVITRLSRLEGENAR
jgi:Domain of unknown function (DUF4296)